MLIFLAPLSIFSFSFIIMETGGKEKQNDCRTSYWIHPFAETKE
ncbi:hypothetical protein BRO54_3187 [Geobacillus proteiniphilus]|uniref:Uncharacterized protein n=1 Tax=Geobacillus proteiniphilus TaxID=860353 RepID=A0A1Q5SPP2_9BACL|nr:hypothetical protein BRO54_3187 [Geobacillus proteiniphilus]